MSEARIPSPADWDLDWSDIALILEPITHSRSRVTALINRFYITEKTASCWIEGVNRWKKEREKASV